MFCPKCGSEVQEGQPFCGKCGAPVGSAAGGAGASGAPSSKKNGAMIGVIVAAVVVVLLVVVGFATNGFGLGGVQPKEAVDVPVAAQGTQTGGEEASADNGDAPSADGQEDDQAAAAGAAVKSAVEAYTWDELSQISAEIAAAGDEAAGIEVAKKYNLCTPDGKLDGTQVKSVTLANGRPVTVQIIGFNHDNRTDGEKSGITFAFADTVTMEDMEMNSSDTNAGGWAASEMRSYLNSEGMALLPQELADRIVEVDKLTNNIGETEDPAAVSATSDKLWLLSAVELCETPVWYSGDRSIYNNVLKAEGSTYKLYRDMAVTLSPGNEILVKVNFAKTPWGWWGRSPSPGFLNNFLYVSTDGFPDLGLNASNQAGVVPAFCI